MSLKLTVTCGGMPVESVYQPVTAGQFPERPVLDGRITPVPKETMQALQTVAPCASADATPSPAMALCFVARRVVKAPAAIVCIHPQQVGRAMRKKAESFR
jgi:hypothetical protein